jgi:orotidine-5'-phosphate decarboxylase
MTNNPIFCALDTPDIAAAVSLAEKLFGSIGGAKLGMEFFYANGAAGYKAVQEAGLPIFLDLKLHDISNTVAKAVHSLMPLAPKIMTVHTQGGPGMMQAASDAADEAAKANGVDRPKMVGVTILTSLDQSDLAAIGVQGAVKDQVVRLAKLAKASGLDGVVCSPLEIEAIRDACGDDFMLVVPGIRPVGSTMGDQKRVLTPREAMDKGADVLVIGRPITGADDPAKAAKEIADSLA